MAKPKFTINFEAIEHIAETIEEINGNNSRDLLKDATYRAMKEIDQRMTTELAKAMKKDETKYKYVHNGVKGRTFKTLDTAIEPEWLTPTILATNLGFNHDLGGASVFTLYGTPHMRPDVKLRKIALVKGDYMKLAYKIMDNAFTQTLKEVIEKNK